MVSETSLKRQRGSWLGEGGAAPERNLHSGGGICCAAVLDSICTIPLDTAKVRLQLQKSAIAGDVTLPKYRGLLGTVGTIAREEGLRSLWKGVVPGLHRQCLCGGLRIGMYEPVKNLYVGKDHVGNVPLSKKILAGLTTGALGIMVANPTDLVKVRLQAEGKLAAGVPKRYTGALNAYATIVRQEGVRALWTGLGPNVARNAIINAAELASYDQVKQTILKIPGFTDNVVTHILSGLGAGFFAGPMAFYKGFVPNFGRLGSWNVIMFLSLEQLKQVQVYERLLLTGVAKCLKSTRLPMNEMRNRETATLVNNSESLPIALSCET
ncbi:hypothetical protein Bca4012_040252 [Brassica carinata]